ncbi:MAG: glycosyltransferase [Methylomarinum sp.]|nr:glycosyltransferase [Methylomarinum sp.]
MSDFHIIIVNDFSFINGGASQIAISSALALSLAGYSVSFFAAVGPISPELRNSQINVICLDQYDILNDPNRVRAISQGVWNKKAARAMDDLLKTKSNQKVIVHIHGFVKALSSSVIKICHQHNVPMVLTLHDYFIACPNGGFYDYQQKKLCLRRAMSFDCLSANCDVRNYKHKIWRVIRHAIQGRMGGVPVIIKHFIYISELSKQILQPYLPEVAKLRYVPNPIDVVQSDRIEAEKNHYYIFIGRLSPEKGINAFCHVVSKFSYPAIVVGDGELLDSLKESYPQIEFTGWLDKTEISCVMNKAKVLVFPTHLYETQGLVVYESLAKGIPVIVPRHCCAAQDIEHGKNGFLYNDSDKTALEVAIHQFERLSTDQIKVLSETSYNLFSNTADSSQQHVIDLISVYNGMCK